MTMNGRSLVARNTCIDVADVALQKASQKQHSAPVGFPSLAEHLPEQAVRDEPLGQLRLRLFSNCDKVDAEHFFSWETVSVGQTDAPSSGASTAESFDSAVHPLIIPPQVSYSNAFQDSPWIGVGPAEALSSSASFSASLDSAVHPLIIAPQVSCGNPFQDSPWIGMESHGIPKNHGGKTTLMFRNLPEGFTRLMLEELLEAEGFASRCNFLYLPAELSSQVCFGYALINMATASDANFFVEHFQGFNNWPVASDKRAVAHMSEELQGLSEMTERYRNSPLMHESVPDCLRPAVYSNGCRVLFPEPTVLLKPPRARKANRKNGVEK